MARKNRLRYITRLDYVYRRRDSDQPRTTRGWWVRFQRRIVDGEVRNVGQAFYDSAHGGKEGSLAAAIRWRNANEARYPPRDFGGKPGSGRKQAPIGHSIFWESHFRGLHQLNGSVKMQDGQRSASFRVSVSKYGWEDAAAQMRSWHRRMRRDLKAAGTLSTDAALKAYWERLSDGRKKGQRLPWK